MDRGFLLSTVEHFCLGLSAPYFSKKGMCERVNALAYPLRGRDGKFYNKYGYYNLPGVTHNPVDVNGWIAGSPLTYYGSNTAGKKVVFVCQEPLDLWRHWQAIGRSSLCRQMLLICSTHRTAFPEEWKEPAFWLRWDTVFLGYSNGDVGEHLTAKLADLIGKEVRPIRPPDRYGKNWTDFWQGGADISEFEGLLRDAPTFSVKLRTEPEGGEDCGRFAYQPVAIDGAFHNGHLYYTIQILNRGTDVFSQEGSGNVVRNVERLETMVVRSDRTIHSAALTAAPKGTKEKDRVMRLTDGTVITGEPRPNKYGTWSWSSIREYLEGRSKARRLGEILNDVQAYLKASVWLPDEEDYALLALVVPVTFAQAIFDSVPLIFLNGPAGSGKSEMGRAMARICCNAYVCGQSSPASIARFIDESRGFVVLDDLEVIGKRVGQFGELVQALKLSYNKATAVKLWTDVKTMRTELLNFYGVKMINNTQGTGDILGSRMLKIRTRRMPEDIKARFGSQPPFDGAKLSRLRDELHSWTFENVRVIENTYRTLYPRTSDRSAEITAPLEVMASLTCNLELKSQLEIALTKQNQQTIPTNDPQQLLRESLKNLIAQGYRTVSPTQLTLEVRRLVSQGSDAQTDEMPKWLNAGWVGRVLHGLDILEEEETLRMRIRLFGVNLRFFTIREAYAAEVKRYFEERGIKIPDGARRPTDFCGECKSCPYSTLGCEIMRKRRATRKPTSY